jgi:hypothetical protein
MYKVTFYVPGVGKAGEVECETQEEAVFHATREYVMEEYSAYVRDSSGDTVKFVLKCSR